VSIAQQANTHLVLALPDAATAQLVTDRIRDLVAALFVQRVDIRLEVCLARLARLVRDLISAPAVVVRVLRDGILQEMLPAEFARQVGTHREKVGPAVVIAFLVSILSLVLLVA